MWSFLPTGSQTVCARSSTPIFAGTDGWKSSSRMVRGTELKQMAAMRTMRPGQCQLLPERCSRGLELQLYESRFVLWRIRNAHARVFGSRAETHGSHRLPAYSLACNEVLRPLWPQRLYPLPRLPVGCHKKILPGV